MKNVFAPLVLTCLLVSGSAWAQSAGDNVVLHKVRPGDTLESLTRRYLGDARYWRENLRLNPEIKDPRQMKPGMTIRLLTDRNIAARSAEVAQVARKVEKKPDPEKWQPAARGDRLRERDGLRTFTASSAQLVFDDGAAVTLTEDSLVFLREARATMRGVKRETVEIVDGQADLSVKPQKKAQSRIEFIVGASRLKPQIEAGTATQTRGRKAASGGSQVMVYAGRTEVEGKEGKVDVPSGMGTSVSASGKPAPPEKLLPAPLMTAPLSGAQVGTRGFAWTPVDGAASYVLEVCEDAECARLIARRTGLTTTSAVIDALPSGTNHWRVTAVSASGLDGYPSSVNAYAFVPAISGTVTIAGFAKTGCDIRREVLLYRDGGDGRADGADDRLLSRSEARCEDGAFSLDRGSETGDFWVVAAAPKRATGGVTVVAEQTSGSAGALCLGNEGPVTLNAAGACFGGRNPSRSDDATGLASSDHVARASAAGDVSFEFSFDVVTNHLDAAPSEAPVQGSLRQFIINGNTLGGERRMRFVPRTEPNVDARRKSWSVVATAPLPEMREGVIFDGVAYAPDGLAPLFGREQREQYPQSRDRAPVSDLNVDLTAIPEG